MVVWGHANAPGTGLIYQFHMPLFFFISGMLIIKNESSFRTFTLEKKRSLLYPFWFWNLFLYPIFFLMYYHSNLSIKNGILDVVRIVLTIDKIPFLGPTWFLPSLFCISIISKRILSIRCNQVVRDAIYGVLGTIICIVGFYYNLPYHWSRTLVCFIFYGCGYFYKKYLYDKIPDKMKKLIIWLLLIFFLLESSDNVVDISQNIYGSRSMFIMGALCAILFLIGISKFYFCDSLVGGHLAWLGKNSIYIVIWHILMFRIAILVQIIVYYIPLDRLTAFPTYSTENGWCLLYVAVGVYGSLAWKSILHRLKRVLCCISKNRRDRIYD